MGSGYIVLSLGVELSIVPLGQVKQSQGEMHMSKQTAQQPQSMIMHAEGAVTPEGAEIRGDLFLSCDTQLRFPVYVPPV